MKALISAAVAAAALFVSCAGTPAPQAAPQPSPAGPVAGPAPAAPTPTQAPAAPAAAPVKKEPRVVTVRIPLETKAMVWFADGSLDESIVSERDPDGRLLGQNKVTASGSLVERTEYSYRDGKLAVRTIKDGEGKTVTVKSFSYDAQGRLVTEALDDGAGKRLSSFEYVYDSAGRRTSWIVKDAKGTPVAETVYGYQDGKLRKAELRDGTGKKTGSSAYEYDSGGYLAKQNFYDALGSLIRVETTAWEKGKPLVEERKSAGGQVQQRTTNEYGADGELLKKTVEDILGKSKIIWTYEYAFREERRTVEE